ncbi:hypothetical protein [Deinococcus sp. UYEF24]
MPLTTEERLEAELGVQATDLGLSSEQYASRLQAWAALAEETQPDTTKQYPTVKVYLLRTWITNLSRQVEKFRAEGELTIEQDTVARIVLLQGDLLLAQSAATVEVPGLASYGPVVGCWGVE